MASPSKQSAVGRKYENKKPGRNSKSKKSLRDPKQFFRDTGSLSNTRTRNGRHATTAKPPVKIAASPSQGTRNLPSHLAAQKAPSPAPVTVKAPSPATPSVTKPLAPSPSVPVVTKTIVTNVQKGAVVNGLVEAKGFRRQLAPTQEKTCISKTKGRKKKTSSCCSLNAPANENKAPSEADKKAKKSSPGSSSSSAKRKSGKDRGSVAEKDTTDPKKFNEALAQKFFQQYSEKKKFRRISDDARLEKMPESSQINASTRQFRKKFKKMPKQPKQPLDRSIFNPNGEPVWVVHELEPEKSEKDAEGKPITNPELMQAMAEDEISMDELNWVESGKNALNGCLDEGKQPEEKWDFY